jgi:HAD superfamily hydrolase (TIGR01509 family)
MRIKALCFDVDGTLSDTDDLYSRRVSRWLPRFLFRDPDQIARRFVMWIESPGNALLSLADALGVDDEMAAIIDWMYRHRRLSSRRFLLVPGVNEMLRKLHGRYPMAVVSSRDERGTMSFLEQFDLTKFFDVIVTGLTVEHTKPYPDPVLFAARRMNVPPEDCVMIGDTTVDMRAGKTAGAQTVGVLCGFGEEAELRKMGANLILKTTSHLTEVLQ